VVFTLFPTHCYAPPCPQCGAKGDPACHFAGGHWPDEMISRTMIRQEEAGAADARAGFEREQAARRGLLKTS
jgi:hypothetical protein